MLNKQEIINKLTEWRNGEIESIIQQELFSKSNNVVCEGIAYGKGYIDAIETVLFEIYDYKIKE